MERFGSRNSSLITLGKCLGFFLLLFMLSELIMVFTRELGTLGSFRAVPFCLAVFSPLLVYEFLIDLDPIYGKIQNFFFRNSFFCQMLPSLLILVALGYFIIPRVMDVSFNKKTFLFIGSIVFMIHLIYVGRSIKGTNFSGVVDYLFLFSMLIITTILLFGAYLRVAYDFHLGKVIMQSVSGASMEIKSLFTQISNK